MGSPRGAQVEGKGSRFVSQAKGLLILVLLVVGAAAAGYFFGTYQKFAPLKSVPPGTPGVIEDIASVATVPEQKPAGLKKNYWMHSKGFEHVGYAISVYINGKLVDKVFNPKKVIDIGKYVHPGENQVRFVARVLPDGMRSGSGWHDLTLNIVATERPAGDRYNESDILVSYKRTRDDFKDYDDKVSFVTLE